MPARRRTMRATGSSTTRRRARCSTTMTASASTPPSRSPLCPRSSTWITGTSTSSEEQDPLRQRAASAALFRFGWVVNCRRGSVEHRAVNKKEQPTSRLLLLSLERQGALLRQLVVDAFDVPVHAEDLLIRQRALPFAFGLGAVLLHDRAFERVELAGGDGGFGVLRHLFHVVRHVLVGRHDDHVRAEPTPGVAGLPGPVENGFDARD